MKLGSRHDRLLAALRTSYRAVPMITRHFYGITVIQKHHQEKIAFGLDLLVEMEQVERAWCSATENQGFWAYRLTNAGWKLQQEAK